MRCLNSVRLKMWISCLVLGASSFVKGEAPAPDPVALALEKSLMTAIEVAEPSVVAISRLRRMPTETPLFDDRPNAPFPLGDLQGNSDDPNSPDFLPSDFGSGVIVAVDPEKTQPRRSYILTNYHVVRGGPTGKPNNRPDAALHVRLANRKGYYANIHAADPRSDLAIIAIETGDARPVNLASIDVPRKGQFVIALGNPYSLARDGSASVSWGIISNVTRRPDPRRHASTENAQKAETMQDLGHLVQVDTRMNLGVSGGALVNLKGELIGLTTALAAISGYEKSVGFAIPMDAATRRIVKTLLEGKEVEYGFLGVTLNPMNVFGGFDSRRRSGGRSGGGVTVISVLPNSPAAHGGMRDRDVVIAVNEIPVHSRMDLMREVGKFPPEASVTLSVIRDEQPIPMSLSVTVGKWGVVDEEGIIAPHRHYPTWRGLAVDFPSARSRFNTWAGATGGIPSAVLVTEVEENSSAAKAQLEAGSLISLVNRTPVKTPREFQQAVRTIQGDVQLTLVDGQKVMLKERP